LLRFFRKEQPSISLAGLPLASHNPGLSRTRLKVLKEAVGEVPSTLVTWLLEHDGAVLQDNMLTEEPYCRIFSLYSAAQIQQTWERSRATLGPGFLPFADSSLGTWYISLLPQSKSKIFYLEGVKPVQAFANLRSWAHAISV
jgi:hypothetical protein